MATVKNVYFNSNNVIDLTTQRINTENPGYVIDERLLNTLLKRVTEGDVDDIKRNLINHINRSTTKEEVFENVNEYIYLNEIAVKAIDVKRERYLASQAKEV